MTVKIYVEGGGDHNKALDTKCRQGFSEFFRKSGLEGRMPSIVACGGRHNAYTRFRTSLHQARPDETPVLLVDSEGPVKGNRWDHVKLRPGDGWDRPDGATDDQIHFMVQAMEAWFHADKDQLQNFYGQNFRLAALSQRRDIDDIPKSDLSSGLQAATRDCQKGEYSKGGHSFEILAHIDPARVRTASLTHGARLLDYLGHLCA